MPEILVLIVVLVLVYGLAGKRPGMAVGAGLLLVLGVLLATILLYFMRSIPSDVATPAVVMVHDQGFSPPHPPVPISVPGNAPIWPFILIVGTLVALVMFLRRPASCAVAAGAHRGWWPVWLLLLGLPLLFFFMARVDRHAQYSGPASTEHVMRIAEVQRGVAHEQAELRVQAEMHRRAMEAAGEIQRRIASMNIYELMDKFDAPRITLSVSPERQHSGHGDESPTAAAIMLSSGEAEVTADAEAVDDHPDVHEEPESPADNAWASVAATSETTDARQIEGDAAQGPRPAWVDQPPKRVGHVRREVVATDEYATDEECYLAADILLQVKTYEHIRWLTGSAQDADKYIRLDETGLRPSELEAHATGLFRQLQNAGITVDYIRREIAKDEHLERVERSIGNMWKLYTLMEFSPSVENDLRQRWETSQQQARFAFVGFGAGSVLGLLGLAWGLLKVDTMTKGYYTKRLFVGVPLGILGLLGLLALFMETIAGH